MPVAVAAPVAVVDGDVDALVESLAGIPKAVVPLAGLADRWGLPDAQLAAIVAAAVDAGRVELWPDAPTGPALIRSSTEADALRLELVAAMGPAYTDLWRREGLNPVLFYAWKKQLLDSAGRIFETPKSPSARLC
jgi:hypothetical protein